MVLDIYPRANTRAINAENQVANLQTQLANSQTQLADLQTQLATLQNDYDLLHQTYEAHRTQHNIFKSRELDGRITIRTQKRRISELLIESFALKLRNRQTYHQLQNKWGKWKNRARNSEQLINNLNQQIFALQNNLPNIQQIGMAGYPTPNFNGYPDEEPEEFIDSFHSYLVAVGIDVTAGHAYRVRAHGLFETCLKGDAKDWYERSFQRKNWELRIY